MSEGVCNHDSIQNGNSSLMEWGSIQFLSFNRNNIMLKPQGFLRMAHVFPLYWYEMTFFQKKYFSRNTALFVSSCCKNTTFLAVI